MSMRHVVWVLDHLTIEDAKAFRVLISLCEWAHKVTNEVPLYPIEELERRAGMSRASVFRKMADLQKMGLITRQDRYDEKGRATSTTTINIDGRKRVANVKQPNPVSLKKRVVSLKLRRTGKSQNRGGLVSKSRGVSLTAEPHKESFALPSINQAESKQTRDGELPLFGGSPPPTPKATEKFIADAFEKFWAVYPKKAGKGDARKAWATALKKASPSVIITAAVAYAKSRAGEEERFTKWPGPWLTAERWLDAPPEPPPPLPMTGRDVGII